MESTKNAKTTPVFFFFSKIHSDNFVHRRGDAASTVYVYDRDGISSRMYIFFVSPFFHHLFRECHYSTYSQLQGERKKSDRDNEKCFARSLSHSSLRLLLSSSAHFVLRLFSLIPDHGDIFSTYWLSKQAVPANGMEESGSYFSVFCCDDDRVVGSSVQHINHAKKKIGERYTHRGGL